MSAKTEDERRRLALAWKSSGQNQQEFARAHNLSPRTLRGYVKAYVVSPRREDVLAVLDGALRELAALRVRLLGDVTCHPAIPGGEVDVASTQMSDVPVGRSPRENPGVAGTCQPALPGCHVQTASIPAAAPQLRRRAFFDSAINDATTKP